MRDFFHSSPGVPVSTVSSILFVTGGSGSVLYYQLRLICVGCHCALFGYFFLSTLVFSCKFWSTVDYTQSFSWFMYSSMFLWWTGDQFRVHPTFISYRRIAYPCNPEQYQCMYVLYSMREKHQIPINEFSCTCFSPKRLLLQQSGCALALASHPVRCLLLLLSLADWIVRSNLSTHSVASKSWSFPTSEFICRHNVIIRWFDSYKKNKVACMLRSTNPTSPRAFSPSSSSSSRSELIL